MRRRAALRSIGAVTALTLLGPLAGCQTLTSGGENTTVTPGTVPADEPRPTTTVPDDRLQVSFYTPSVDRLEAMTRLGRTTVGATDPTDPHLLLLVNDRVETWDLTLRIVRGEPAGAVLVAGVALPTNSYHVYELVAEGRYRATVDVDARTDGNDTTDDLAALEPYTDEFVVSADWFDRPASLTVVATTPDGYWRGTLLDRDVYAHLVRE